MNSIITTEDVIHQAYKQEEGIPAVHHGDKEKRGDTTWWPETVEDEKYVDQENKWSIDKVLWTDAM